LLVIATFATPLGVLKEGKEAPPCLTAVWLQPLHIGAKFLTLQLQGQVSGCDWFAPMVFH
jgi:hypothetical protein